MTIPVDAPNKIDWFMEPWEGLVAMGFSADVHDASTGQVRKWDDSAKVWRCAACLMASQYGHHGFCALA